MHAPTRMNAEQLSLCARSCSCTLLPGVDPASRQYAEGNGSACQRTTEDDQAIRSMVPVFERSFGWFVRSTETTGLADAGAGGATDDAAGAGGGGMAGGAAGQGGSGMRDASLPRVPAKHRAVAEACDHERAPSPPVPPKDATTWYSCQSDADCTEGSNGRCTQGSVRIDPYIRKSSVCTYDVCFTDDDCSMGAMTRRHCECGGDAGNKCTGGGCQTDADCPGSYCSPTFGSCGNLSGVESYQCHTAADECVDDADCVNAGPSSLGQSPYCAFAPAEAPAVGHWKCSSRQCAI